MSIQGAKDMINISAAKVDQAAGVISTAEEPFNQILGIMQEGSNLIDEARAAVGQAMAQAGGPTEQLWTLAQGLQDDINSFIRHLQGMREGVVTYHEAAQSYSNAAAETINELGA